MILPPKDRFTTPSTRMAAALARFVARAELGRRWRPRTGWAAPLALTLRRKSEFGLQVHWHRQLHVSSSTLVHTFPKLAWGIALHVHRVLQMRALSSVPQREQRMERESFRTSLYRQVRTATVQSWSRYAQTRYVAVARPVERGPAASTAVQRASKRLRVQDVVHVLAAVSRDGKLVPATVHHSTRIYRCEGAVRAARVASSGVRVFEAPIGRPTPGAVFPTSAAPTPLQVEQLAEQVMRQLDRRVIAARERLGRV